MHNHPDQAAPFRKTLTVNRRKMEKPLIINKAAEKEYASISSDSLLGSHKVISIVHSGKIYQLRATRHGKLILTK